MSTNGRVEYPGINLANLIQAHWYIGIQWINIVHANNAYPDLLADEKHPGMHSRLCKAF
jgi:hypothetical protein